MPRNKIHETLADLHEQLSGTPSFDDADRDHLREVLGEIKEAISADQIHTSVSDRVQQAIVKFEVTHPTIATALCGVIDSLNKL